MKLSARPREREQDHATKPVQMTTPGAQLLHTVRFPKAASDLVRSLMLNPLCFPLSEAFKLAGSCIYHQTHSRNAKDLVEAGSA
jgi:hypothetical protein